MWEWVDDNLEYWILTICKLNINIRLLYVKISGVNGIRYIFFYLSHHLKNGKGECKTFSNFDISPCSLGEGEGEREREREDNILLLKIVRSKHLTIHGVIAFKVIGQILLTW